MGPRSTSSSRTSRGSSDVHRVAQELLDRVERIDVLINSAGVHCTRRELTADGHERVFAVNHLAPFVLTHRLLPRMREGDGGRVLQVNSQGHRFGGLNLADLDWRRRFYVGLLAYGASKTAQLLSVWELADRLAGERRDDQRHASGRGPLRHRAEQRPALPGFPAARDRTVLGGRARLGRVAARLGRRAGARAA